MAKEKVPKMTLPYNIIHTISRHYVFLVHVCIKVNMRGLDGYTALIRACFERLDIVRILVKRPDVDVNLASYYGTTALTFAIRNGNAAAVNELLKHPRKSGSKDFFNGKIDQFWDV